MKTATNTSTAVATKAANAMVVAGDELDWMNDVGAGLEGADKDSFAIPFLRVIQKMSPQVDESDAAYVPEAKAGMFMNSVTGELFDGKEGVLFIPCAFQRRFLRWGPRSGEGSGFKGELMPEEVALMRDRGEIAELERRLYAPGSDGKVNPKTSDRFSDTRSHFGLLLRADGTFSRVLLALGSTQIKKSKQMISMLSEAKVQTARGALTPPTWMNIFRITTVVESNDEGSWHGVKPEAAGFVDRADVYEAGKAFNAAISAGEAKANFAEAEGEAPKSDAF